MALDGEVLVAVEVKTGRGTLNARHAPREHLKGRTLRRQREALRSLGLGSPLRIDLVEILVLPGGARHLTHLVGLKLSDQ